MHLIYIVHFKTGGKDITKASVLQYKLGLSAQQKLWNGCMMKRIFFLTVYKKHLLNGLSEHTVAYLIL